MTMAETRTHLATTITANLSDITVNPYQPSSPAPFTGWLQVDQVDEEDATYGEVRLTVELQILVATDRSDFEKVQDTLSVPLIAAIKVAGGWGTVVQPFTDTLNSTTFYALSAKFVTVANTESEVA